MWESDGESARVVEAASRRSAHIVQGQRRAASQIMTKASMLTSSTACCYSSSRMPSSTVSSVHPPIPRSCEK